MNVNLHERAPRVWRIRIETRDKSGQRRFSYETFRGDRAAAEQRRNTIKKEGKEPRQVTRFAANNLTTPKPLGLSNIQLELLLDKASYVEPQWRSRFLSNVVGGACFFFSPGGYCRARDCVFLAKQPVFFAGRTQ